MPSDSSLNTPMPEGAMGAGFMNANSELTPPTPEATPVMADANTISEDSQFMAGAEAVAPVDTQPTPVWGAEAPVEAPVPETSTPLSQTEAPAEVTPEASTFGQAETSQNVEPFSIPESDSETAAPAEANDEGVEIPISTVQNHDVLPDFPVAEATPTPEDVPRPIPEVAPIEAPEPEPQPGFQPTVIEGGGEEVTEPEPAAFKPFEMPQPVEAPEPMVFATPEVEREEQEPAVDVDAMIDEANKSKEAFIKQAESIIRAIDDEKEKINRQFLAESEAHRDALSDLKNDFEKKKANHVSAIKDLDANRADIVKNLGIVEDGQVDVKGRRKAA